MSEPRDRFDCTPQQYHAGLDILWAALGPKELGDYHTIYHAIAYELGYARNEISKKQRKINQMRETIEHLHERLARVQSSKVNKASQIARLNRELEELRAKCDKSEAHLLDIYLAASDFDLVVDIVCEALEPKDPEEMLADRMEKSLGARSLECKSDQPTKGGDYHAP